MGLCLFCFCVRIAKFKLFSFVSFIQLGFVGEQKTKSTVSTFGHPFDQVVISYISILLRCPLGTRIYLAGKRRYKRRFSQFMTLLGTAMFTEKQDLLAQNRSLKPAGSSAQYLYTFGTLL